MLRILADDHYMAVTLDYLALVADFLYGRLYFQSFYHLSEICASALFAAPGDSALRGVIDRNLDCDLVAKQDLDIVHAEFAGDMGGYDHIVGQFDLEGCIGEYLNDWTFKLHYVIFRQKNLLLSIIQSGCGSQTIVRRIGPSAVSATVCS